MTGDSESEVRIDGLLSEACESVAQKWEAIGRDLEARHKNAMRAWRNSKTPRDVNNVDAHDTNLAHMREGHPEVEAAVTKGLVNGWCDCAHPECAYRRALACGLSQVICGMAVHDGAPEAAAEDLEQKIFGLVHIVTAMLNDKGWRAFNTHKL